MGQNLSSSITPPPLTLQDCLVDGEMNLSRFIYYRRQLDYSTNYTSYCSARLKRKRNDTMETNTSVKKKRTRTVKRHALVVRDKDGNLREILPTDTLWYLLYIASPPHNKRLMDQFRKRFRLPYDRFIELTEELIQHPLFKRYTCTDATGKESSDIKLLLLGALRYIGRAWTFDDVAEANGISIDTNREFVYLFLEYGSTVLYKKYVIDEFSTVSVKEKESLFRLAGFNGCIGSCDATHVAMLSCPFWAQNENKGYKLNCPSRTYNVTVDHSRKVLGTTFGHPATWNDKTIVLFDPLVTSVKDGYVPDDFEFTLKEYDTDGNVVDIIYKGVWFMVDNGYLAWSCTVPPIKNATRYNAIRFSEWLESMRKDVECFFGILKGRFRILRYGYRFHSIYRCDQLFVTCCALHNCLLMSDGLDKNWDTGGKSVWEKEYQNSKDEGEIIGTPFAIQRLNRLKAKESERAFSSQQAKTKSKANQCKKCTVDGKRIVSSMSLSFFQQCLIEHFDICFKNNNIKWPKHMKKP